MSEIKLRVNEAAKEIGETVHVVRNWLRDYKEHIPTEKSESGYHLFDESAVAVLRKIQKLSRKNNFSARQIEHYLSSGGDPFGAAPAEIEKDKKLDKILTRLNKQEEFNKALLLKLDEQSRNIENLVNDRDKKLMAGLREIRETKHLQNNKKWFEFWKG